MCYWGPRLKLYKYLVLVLFLFVSCHSVANPNTIKGLKQLCQAELENKEHQDCSMLLGYHLAMMYNPSSEEGSKFEICDDNLTSELFAQKFVTFLELDPKQENLSLYSVLSVFFEQEIMCGT
ncbi:hypothetical protein A6F57_19250 [Alteromonas stellipolaris]|nr:hypothetical protein A6K25_13435 [Alteromonas stellipolaris]ANB27127.1 hypothetical protein A6F57_19250 [Alteromonas stellipolaris]